MSSEEYIQLSKEQQKHLHKALEHITMCVVALEFTNLYKYLYRHEKYAKSLKGLRDEIIRLNQDYLEEG